LPAALVAGGGS